MYAILLPAIAPCSALHCNFDSQWYPGNRKFKPQFTSNLQPSIPRVLTWCNDENVEAPWQPLPLSLSLSLSLPPSLLD